MADIELTHADGAAFLARLDEVTDIYLALRAPGEYGSDLFSRSTFVDRTTRQANSPGFEAALATEDGPLVGFAFGIVFAPGHWWGGQPTPPPAEILAEAKFAVIELDVAADRQGRGYGRRLLDSLLAGRGEPYAVLTSMPDSPARAMYARWGWQQHGTAVHAPGAPTMDQLVLPLR